MTRNYIFLLIIFSLVISGCQPSPPPADPESIKNTAVAIAWTSVSQTQIASTPQPTLPVISVSHSTPQPTKLASPSTSAGTWYDSHAIPHKITIKKINGSYKLTSKYGDGSGETISLVVKIVNGEERLYEDPENYFGDYMVIKGNGYLAFFDNQGFIYELKPE